ncbi:MAG TPA: hypothetical protein VE953_23910 [Terriglobales bacterium]|nr:hypothetical protein [Terriglobales bacterium]
MAGELDEGQDLGADRARWIRAVGDARAAGGRRPRQRDVAKLIEDWELRRSASMEDVRELARTRVDGPVVSLYLDLGAARVVRDPPVYLTVFHSLRRQELEARHDLVAGLPHDRRLRVGADLDEIEELLRALDPAGRRSVVLFKAGRELNRALALPVRTADSLTIDADPNVEPLEAALESQASVLVVEVRTEESRFSRYHLGTLEQVDRLESFVPGGTVVTSRPEKAQRHRLTHLQWHLRLTAQRAAALLSEPGYDVVVLAGGERVVADLERFLHGDVRAHVVATLHPAPDWDRGEWQRRLDQVIAEHRRSVEEAALSRLDEYAGHGLLVRGLEAVVDAMNLFLVRMLFVSHGLTRQGAVCREHHYLSLSSGRCPYDATELEPVDNVVDELVEVARLHGVELMVVVERTDLLEPDGVAAVRYDLGSEERLE